MRWLHRVGSSLRSRVDLSQETPQTSNTPTIDGMHTSVQETVSDGFARGAVYLAAAFQEHNRHEFEAHRVEEDTQLDWQGTRYVLGESGYYLPDNTRASWSIGGKYNQGKEGVATAYEWFLNLPPVVLLPVMWVAGVALLGMSALVLYWVGRVLAGLIAGSI
jgi:hypothetical protein